MGTVNDSSINASSQYTNIYAPPPSPLTIAAATAAAVAVAAVDYIILYVCVLVLISVSVSVSVRTDGETSKQAMVDGMELRDWYDV